MAGARAGSPGQTDQKGPGHWEPCLQPEREDRSGHGCLTHACPLVPRSHRPSDA